MSDQTASTSLVQPEQKKGSSKKIIVACCLVFVLVLCLCCGAVAAIFGVTASSTLAVYNEVQSSIIKVCDGGETDLKGFYDSTMSKEFKKNTNYSEFRIFFQEYKSIILDCAKVKDGSFLTSKLNGAKVNTETTNGVEELTVVYPSGSSNVTIVFVKEGTAWKINTINIK